MIKVLEKEFYYLDNFQRVLDWIAQRYADLLNDEERSFVAAFPGLPQPARALFVRMVMRKGTLFRAGKLNYPEIGCPREAASALLPTGWIEADPVLTLDELFDLLLKPEIAAAFALPSPLKNARKAEQLELLRETHIEERAFSHWHPECADTVWRLLVQPLCDRLRLIFFGNLSQDWTEFVLSDLGVFRYEQVEFSPAARGFRTREDIEHYLQLHACKERYWAEEPALDILQDVPHHAFDNAWLDSRREKLLFQLGQQLEKDKDWTRAHEVYASCRYPGARGRAIRVLEKHERFAEAYALFEIANAAPESEAERQHLLRIGPRLARKLGHARIAPRRAAQVQRLDLCLPPPATADDWRVEGVVLDHLWQEEAPVYYVENTLANTLFGLLCWPAIFAAIPGAFFHPFHRGPADLYSADFHSRRKQEFEACLARLDDGSYREVILATFDAKAGLQSPFVAWDWLGRELIELALDCIPAAHLKLWCRRILADVKDNRTGFPDLIQFWPGEGRYNMIEVKGPGDRLQDNQLRWIEYCGAHGMPITVCYLQWGQAAA